MKKAMKQTDDEEAPPMKAMKAMRAMKANHEVRSWPDSFGVVAISRKAPQRVPFWRVLCRVRLSEASSFRHDAKESLFACADYVDARCKWHEVMGAEQTMLFGKDLD